MMLKLLAFIAIIVTASLPCAAEDAAPDSNFTVSEYDIPPVIVRPVIIQGGVKREQKSAFKTIVDTIFHDYPEKGGDIPGPGSFGNIDSTLTTLGFDGSPLFSSNTNMQSMNPAIIPQSIFPRSIGGSWRPHDMPKVEPLGSSGSASLGRH